MHTLETKINKRKNQLINQAKYNNHDKEKCQSLIQKIGKNKIMKILEILTKQN